MTDMVCCPLEGGGPYGDRPALWSVRRVKARKQHECEECCEPITVGTLHERVACKHDRADPIYSLRTCLSCVEIRDHFACGNGWTIGQVWSQLAANFFPTMTAGGPCMQGLSPAAKARLFERRLAWMGNR